jgi:hypothetical protein
MVIKKIYEPQLLRYGNVDVNVSTNVNCIDVYSSNFTSKIKLEAVDGSNKR